MLPPEEAFAQVTVDGKGTTVEGIFAQDVADGYESRDIFIDLATPAHVVGLELLSWSTATGFQKEQEDDLIKENFKQIFIASQGEATDRDQPWKQDWFDNVLDLHRLQSSPKSVECLYDFLIIGSDNFKRGIRDCTSDEVRDVFLRKEAEFLRNPVQANIELGGTRRRLKPIKKPLILAAALAKRKLDIEQALVQKKHILINGSGIAKETFRVYVLMFVLMVVNAAKAHFRRTGRALPTIIRLEEAGAFELIAPFIPEFMMTLRDPWKTFFKIYSQALTDFGDNRTKLMSNAPEKRFFGVGSDEDMELVSRFLALAGFDAKRLHYRTKQQFSDGVEERRTRSVNHHTGKSIKMENGLPKTTKQESGGSTEGVTLVAKQRVEDVDHYMDVSTQQGDRASNLFQKRNGEHVLVRNGIVFPDAYEPMLPPVWGKGEPGERDGAFDVNDLPEEVKAEYPLSDLFPNPVVTLYEYRLQTAIYRQRLQPFVTKVLWNVTTSPVTSEPEPAPIPPIRKGGKGMRRASP